MNTATYPWKESPNKTVHSVGTKGIFHLIILNTGSVLISAYLKALPVWMLEHGAHNRQLIPVHILFKGSVLKTYRISETLYSCNPDLYKFFVAVEIRICFVRCSVVDPEWFSPDQDYNLKLGQVSTGIKKWSVHSVHLAGPGHTLHWMCTTVQG